MNPNSQTDVAHCWHFSHCCAEVSFFFFHAVLLKQADIENETKWRQVWSSVTWRLPVRTSQRDLEWWWRENAFLSDTITLLTDSSGMASCSEFMQHYVTCDDSLQTPKHLKFSRWILLRTWWKPDEQSQWRVYYAAFFFSARSKMKNKIL